MPQNNVKKTPSGQYRYRTTDKSGRRLEIRSRKNETRRDFLKRCDALDKQAESGSILTLNDLFNLWMEEHVKPYLSPSERRITPPIYRRHIYPYLGRKRLSDIARADVYRVLIRARKNGLSMPHIKKIRGCISRPFNWAINTLGLELTNPTQGLIFRAAPDQSEPVRRRAITDHDMERFMTAAAGSKYFNYFRILSLTGLRPSECLGLKISDIKPDHLEIRRGITIDGLSDLKTRAAKRDIPMSEPLRTALTDQRSKIAFSSSEGWLFPSETPDRMPSMDALISAFKRIKKQTAVYDRGGRNGLKKLSLAEPPVRFNLYDFRHTFATKMAERGMSQTALQAIMGHTDISITLKYYIELTDQMIDEAKEIMAALG